MPYQAEDLNVRDVFALSEDLRMPPYQRGYSWTEKEAGELLTDIQEAATASRPYFLGAIVVVQDQPKGMIEVVDGQQRLTTLSILLAVLRDMADTKDEANRLHEMLETPGRAFPREKPRWRLTLNHIDTPFFRQTVQKRGATLEADNYETESESRHNILQNLQAMRDTLQHMNQADRTALGGFILKQCIMVKVTVSDRDAGYGAFRVLNTRGKQPSAHDILKSDLFERAGFSDEEASDHSIAWNEFSHRLGSQGFDELLKQIRALFDRPGRGDMVTGFRDHVLTKVPARTFLEDMLPRYVDAYEIISGLRKAGNGFPPLVRRYINFARALEHSGWRAPALKYLVNGDLAEAPATDFFRRLERLAFAMQFVITDRDARTRRYRRVINAIENGDDLTAPDSPLALSADERRQLSERLIGRFATFRQRRAMSLRLNALVPNGNAISPDADATLEHILPRNPKQNSDWMANWPKAPERRELVDCLGNFTLLTNAENQEADRQEFDGKKAVFFRKGVASFRLSDDIQPAKQWTPETVRRRRDWLAGLLKRAWEL